MAVAEISMMGGGGKAGLDAIVVTIAVAIVGRGHVCIGRHHLRESGVVKQSPALHAQLESQVVGGQVTHASDRCFIDCFTRVIKAPMLLTDSAALPFAGVDTGPCQHVKIVKAAADEEVAAQLSIVACAGLDLHTIDIGPLFGDDVHHACQGYATIERRGRTSQHLNLFHFLERDAEIGGGRIRQIAIQAVTVEHEEHLLLRTAVDAAHGDVDIIIAIDETDTRHIGGQYLLQVAPAAGGNHLFGDERRGHRHFVETLRDVRGCRDGSCHASLDLVHDISKLWRVLCRHGVVRILFEHHRNIAFRLLDVEVLQIAESYQSQRTLPEVAVEGFEMLQEDAASLLGAPNPIVVLCLVVHIAHLGVVSLCRGCEERAAESKDYCQEYHFPNVFPIYFFLFHPHFHLF